MTDIQVLAAFGATSFTYVFLKALQQLNVVHNQYLWIMPASFGMAACEFFLIIKTVELATSMSIIAVGTGSCLGCYAAMYLHKKLRKQ